MNLARDLGMTLRHLLLSIDARELGMWLALAHLEHDEVKQAEKLSNLAGKAERSLAQHRRK